MKKYFPLDLLKVCATLVIMFHHFFIYSAIEYINLTAISEFTSLISDKGRLAVQCFLVIGGFLVVGSLTTTNETKVVKLAAKRYIRLAPKLGIALFFVISITYFYQNHLLDKPWVSKLPTLELLLAHFFLVQDILGMPALSAGVWYVAIDFQLFIAAILLLRFINSKEVIGGLLFFLIIFSATRTSKTSDLDAYFIYYFYSYGLGMLAYMTKKSALNKFLFIFAQIILLIKGITEYDIRYIASFCTAFVFFLPNPSTFRVSELSKLAFKSIQYFSNISYSVFIGHFPMIIFLAANKTKYAFEINKDSDLFIYLAAYFFGTLVIAETIEFLHAIIFSQTKYRSEAASIK